MNDVSVVMPARNAASTIEASLRSLLDQSHLLEILVVDDGSDDGTGKVAKRLGDDRVKVLRTEGVGIASALNLGFEAAEGAFAARCDADDVYLPGRLAWQRAFLEARPGVVAVSCGFRTLTKRGRKVADLACEGDERDVTPALLRGEPVTTFCAWLTRGVSIRQCGGARPWFVTAEDMDLQFRLAALGTVWHRPVAGYGYRLHDQSIMHSRGKALHAFYDSHARAFALQRAARGRDDLQDGRPPSPTEALDCSARHKASQHISNHLEGEAWRTFARRGMVRALPVMIRAIRHAPGEVRKWRRLGVMLTKGLLGGGGLGPTGGKGKQ